MKKDYEPPTIVVLGTVADLTEINLDGPNPDIQLNAPSVPA